MAVWSVIPFSLASKERRFGAEFWMPEYLDPLRQDRNWVPIGELVKSCQYGISREMNEEGIGVPIYRMNEMDDLFLSTPAKNVIVSDSEYKEFQLSIGDVLFNRTNSFKFVGRTGILKDPIDAVFASYLIRLLPDTACLLPEYLTVYLNCPTGIAQVKRRAMESINQTNVSASEIKKVPIPLFPLTFQEEIAAIVDQAAELRRHAKRFYQRAEEELLDELRLSQLDLSSDLFGVRTYAETAELKRFDAEHFQPIYWRITNLCRKYEGGYQEIGDLMESITNGVESRYFVEYGVPYIRVGDMQNLRINTVSAEKIPQEEAQALLPKIRLKVGDVLTARSGSIGQAVVVTKPDIDSVLSSHLMRLRLRNDSPIQSTYLALFLSSFPGVKQILMHSNGGIVPEISQPNLKRIVVPILSKQAQERITNLVFNSHEAEDESKRLLEKAKQTVENMIIGRV